jgi:hypothetical protein
MNEQQMLQFCVQPATAPEKPAHLQIIMGPARLSGPKPIQRFSRE